MAFGATLTLTVNSVAKVLNRINQDNYGSEYYLRNATESYRARIRHTKEARDASGRVNDRHNVEVVHTVFGVGGALDTVRTMYIIMRAPENDDLTTLGHNVAAFTAYVNDNTVRSDVLNWMS